MRITRTALTLGILVGLAVVFTGCVTAKPGQEANVAVYRAYSAIGLTGNTAIDLWNAYYAEHPDVSVDTRTAVSKCYRAYVKAMENAEAAIRRWRSMPPSTPAPALDTAIESVECLRIAVGAATGKPIAAGAYLER